MSGKSQSTQMDKSERPAPVAQQEREAGGILTCEVSNPQYNNNSENQYSLPQVSIIQKLQPSELKEILSAHVNIMARTSRREVYFWFLEKKAGIANMVTVDTAVCYKLVYDEINWLKKNDYIESYGTIKVVKKSGPKPTLYGLPDLPKETIARSIIAAQESYTNVYKVVRELTQRIFEDVQFEEIQFSKILNLSKKNNQGFHFLDIANLVATELHNKGVKVWR